LVSYPCSPGWLAGVLYISPSSSAHVNRKLPGDAFKKR
jgi:hypothetical protein